MKSTPGAMNSKIASISLTRERIATPPEKSGHQRGLRRAVSSALLDYYFLVVIDPASHEMAFTRRLWQRQYRLGEEFNRTHQPHHEPHTHVAEQAHGKEQNPIGYHLLVAIAPAIAAGNDVRTSLSIDVVKSSSNRTSAGCCAELANAY